MSSSSSPAITPYNSSSFSDDGDFHTWLPGVGYATLLAVIFMFSLGCWLHAIHVSSLAKEEQERGRSSYGGESSSPQPSNAASSPLWIIQTPTRKEVMHQDVSVSNEAAATAAAAANAKKEQAIRKPYDPSR